MKNTNFFERIMQLADYKGFKNPNDFAKNALGWTSSEKINRLKDGFKMPSVDILLEISNKFEDVNTEWLLTGKGEMIKKEKKQVQKNEGNNNTLNNINGRVKGDITISHNELTDFIAVQKEMSEIVRTAQNQLTESQTQITTLLDILKRK